MFVLKMKFWILCVLKVKNLNKVFNAYALANHLHKGMVRKNGDPFLVHPLRVAYRLMRFGKYDHRVICAALLHDVVEDCEYSLDRLESVFGRDIALMVYHLSAPPVEGPRYIRKIEAAKWFGTDWQLKPITDDVRCVDVMDNCDDFNKGQPLAFWKVWFREKHIVLNLCATGDAHIWNVAMKKLVDTDILRHRSSD